MASTHTDEIIQHTSSLNIANEDLLTKGCEDLLKKEHWILEGALPTGTTRLNAMTSKTNVTTTTTTTVEVLSSCVL